MATRGNDFEAFRSQLFTSLKARGTLDTLKVCAAYLTSSWFRSAPLIEHVPSMQTQVRASLISDIKQKGHLHTPAAAAIPKTLESRALDSLILSHLRSRRYEYSASIFLTEAGLTSAVVSDADACHVFRLPPIPLNGGPADEEHSALFRALAATTKQRPAAMISSGSQTEETDATSLETKLAMVDRRLERGQAAELPVHLLEDHMLKYQREADARAAAQLKAEVERLHEVGSSLALN
jgi:hypothetical protein